MFRIYLLITSIVISAISSFDVYAKTYRCKIGDTYKELKYPCPNTCNRGNTSVYTSSMNKCENSETSDTGVRVIGENGRKLKMLDNMMTHQREVHIIDNEEKKFNTIEKFENYKWDNNSGGMINK